MKYLVMECHPGYAILLDEEGRFRKAANLHYKVGQTVRDPVWMRTERRRPARWVRSGIAAAAACLLLFLGVQFYQGYLQPYSFIYLTINPEVRMNLNRQGTVVGLAGTNADGEALLEAQDNLYESGGWGVVQLEGGHTRILSVKVTEGGQRA